MLGYCIPYIYLIYTGHFICHQQSTFIQRTVAHWIFSLFLACIMQTEAKLAVCQKYQDVVLIRKKISSVHRTSLPCLPCPTMQNAGTIQSIVTTTVAKMTSFFFIFFTISLRYFITKFTSENFKVRNQLCRFRILALLKMILNQKFASTFSLLRSPQTGATLFYNSLN